MLKVAPRLFGIATKPEARKAMYYIGLDIHKKNTQACVKDEQGKTITNERFLSDAGAINAFLNRLGDVRAKVVMEATGFYQYIYDVIESRGYIVVLANPLRLQALTAGRTKNDENDAETLAELLRINAVPQSFVPPKEIRDLRELTRHRSSLVAESTSLKNKIHAELDRKGTKPPAGMRKPFTKKFTAWLRTLGSAVIDDLLDVLEFVQRKIKEVEKRIAEVAKKDEEIQRLETIPGVGHVVATTVKAETGGLGRFDSSGGLISYAGLAPRTWQSGEKEPRSGRMSKQGNARLRYVLIEAVHVHVMRRKDSQLTLYYNKKKEEKGSGKAAVAAAKKLLEMMYLMTVREQPYHAH